MKIKNSIFGIIHRAIKSEGKRYTISLLVNYTGNPELRSFYYSMLHPNNTCRKHLIRFIRERKNLQYEGNGYLQKIFRSCKKLTNYEHLALSKTKSKPKFLQGFIGPVHFLVAMENTSNPRRQLIHK